VYVYETKGPGKQKAIVLKSNCEKTRSLRISVDCNKKLQIRGENVEEVEKFTYIGSEITRDGEQRYL
jgi:hypothetical protein